MTAHLGSSTTFLLLASRSDTASPSLERCRPRCFGVILSRRGCVRWSVFKGTGQVGEGLWCTGEGQTVVRFPGWRGSEPGREAWQAAKARNTQSLVWSPGMHPAQVLKEAGWRDTQEKGKDNQEKKKKKEHADTLQRADWVAYLNLVFMLEHKVVCHCEGSGGINSQQAVSFQGTREGVICLLFVS